MSHGSSQEPVGGVAERVTVIDDLADPRVADYRNLKEADLSRLRGAFIAESEVVLRVLVSRGRYPIRSVFLAESRLDKVADALRALPPEVPIYVAPQAVLSGVVGFRLHRGVLASGERPAGDDLATILGEARRVVVLEGLTNHDNVGSVFRNAAAFGVDGVILDETSCDPLYRKAIRVSVGASLFVPWTRSPSTAASLAALREAGFFVIALSPRLDAMPLEQAVPRDGRKVALLVGTEGPGLTTASMGRADVVARIDMAPGFDSLNVATATGIGLFVLRSANPG
ncbi:MAG: RNA methyltransferase [Myxococcales bacterium]|nr:RNA methyltransferase [Myxococcales bacterium]